MKVTCFLEEAVKVVPVESVLNAIADARYDIALRCATALKASKLTLQPSQLMGTGLLRALFRAIYGISGEMFEQLHNSTAANEDPVRTTPAFSVSQLLLGAFGNVPDIHEHTLSDNSQTPQQNSVPYTRTTMSNYADVVSGRSRGEVQSTLQMPQLHRYLSQEQDPHLIPQVFMAIQQVTFPSFILDPKAYPEKIFFPPEITEYLRSCMDDLTCRANKISDHGKKELEVVSRTNLEEIYPTSATIRRHIQFESPLHVLAKAMVKLSYFIKESEWEMNLATAPKHHSNKEMLKLISKIYNNDVALCAALLGAFMEQHIRIPFLKSPQDTAKALSSPIAVGVWALFSVSREKLQEMLESSKNDELVVEIKEYIQSVLTDQPQEDEEKLYAGKLQFLLQGMHKTVTSSTQYISYSLEYQLCNNLKFPKDTSVRDLITLWDKIFENDVLSLVAKSHRPLVARWLKWTILVHDLREVLAEYTCIGVTGLINSGKSQLVKQLFNIKVQHILFSIHGHAQRGIIISQCSLTPMQL